MLFNSLDFVAFFAVVYALYLALPHRGQNLMLLAASYFFYGCWDWRFLSLVLISTCIDYFAGQAIHGTEDPRKRKLFLAVSMTANLGLLGFFKYYNFFIGSAQSLLASVGLHVETWTLNIILPVGISFYTFQTMSYAIDIYRRELEPTRKFLDFALFVTFFPQLVAGPIERASNLLPQVLRPRAITWSGVEAGAWLIFWGFFKKIVVADNVAGISDAVFGGQVELTTGSVLLGVYAFAFQIYCDFSAYSDIARGTAALMGFDLMVNFRNPYGAVNPSDFWRRWHISLSTWLRDYLYIPLGGNRRGPRRTYINLALTMLLGGLWHGAAWTFVLWGAYHGLLLGVHRAMTGGKRERADFSFWGRAVRRAGMFHLVCVSWLLFRATSVGQVGDMLGALALNPGFSFQDAAWLFALATLCVPLAMVEWMQEKTDDPVAPLRLSLAPKAAFICVCLLMMICFGNTGGHAFIYFQF